MKIGIHYSRGSFSERWIAYCKKNNIDFKLVNCYQSNILQQLIDCDALMWHFNHQSPKDILFAKQLIYSVEIAGKKVFPNYRTCWHFDDKVGQKYLLEAISAPLVPSYIFYSKDNALAWVSQVSFPKVFKLRGGSSSANVKLVRDRRSAVHLVNIAFGRGFSQYDSFGILKERIRKYRLGQESLVGVFKGFARLLIIPKFSKIKGKEKGYVYFQDFIPNNDSDIRVVVIGEKAFAIKREVREHDFRASGSGSILYDKKFFDERCVKIAFETTEKLDAQCLAYDFIFNDRNMPLITEISFGFIEQTSDACTGYWDRELVWHEGKFIPQGWIIEELIKNAI